MSVWLVVGALVALWLGVAVMVGLLIGRTIRLRDTQVAREEGSSGAVPGP